MHKSYSCKRIVFSFFLFTSLFSSIKIFGQSDDKKNSANTADNVRGSKLKWQVNPLDRKIFIKNNGQFDTDVNSSDKVLYQASLGNAKAYFNSHGLIYRYDDYSGVGTNKSAKPVTKYLTVDWENASPEVTIESQSELSYYYTYPKDENGIITASVFRKIIYKNIYPGIDVEYTFPKDKDGIKYDLIVHPGADLSVVKLKYAGAKKAYKDEHGNIVVNTNMGDFTDHAPVSFYKEGGNVNASYILNGAEESFVINGNYTKSSTIVIDPWTTNPVFTASYDKAYDLDYDNNGNVYVYGGYNPFQLVKLDNTGTIKWTFNASSIDGVIYGDFAVDKKSGSSYIIEGAHATGARALKINTLGTLLATFPGDTNMNEMWRVVFDPCSGRMVIGAGGTNSDYQACTLDTNMTKLKVVNVLGASSPGHSMVFTAIDPTGASCYMAAAKSAVLDTAKFNNVLVKMPLPTLTPTVYNVSDGYKLVELASVNYVGPGPGSANGMNGMAVSPNWLYMSDGSTLRKADKNTGAIVNSISISGTSFAWGGLDADICDNVYAGEQSSINVYSSSLSLLSTIALPGIVYDVVLGPNQKTVYACGRAYVSSFDVASSLTLNKIVTPAKCGCNGSAKVTLMACGSLDTTKIAYSWSNGQTTQTANNLCAGIYTVTVLSGCSPIYIDTVAIPSHFVLLNIPSPSICTGGKGVSLTASGAKTYVWKPGTGLSATNTATVKANPATTTTYTVTGTTGGGCKDSDVVVVTVNTTPTVTVSGPLTPVCPNTPVNLTASGASGYTWTPAASVSCATCGKTTASIANITTFTVVGDSLGCTDTAKITVKVYPVPTITINTTPTACDSFTGTATATVSGSGPYTYSWSPAGGTATNAKGLSAGSYVISVTDTNGCITTKTCIINVTPSPTVTATAGVATCDSTNGKTTVTIVGGTGPYTYLWSPGGGTKSTDINLGAGIYSVTVTDVNGCKGSSFTILEDTGATIKFSARNNISCFGGSDGGATVTLVGGTLPYAYAWSPVGETTASVNNLSVGQYTVIVTDKNHCTLIDTLNIHQPSQITASITAANVSNVSCFGGSNGKISVVPGGGTAPYTYLWNDGQTGDTATGLMANSYTATVTDKNGCSVTAFDSVKQPPVLVASASNTSATCGKNGSASVVTIGGTPGYVFNWSGGSGNGSTIYGLGKGTYTCTVTDANGCTDTASTTVDTIGQTAKIKSSKNVTCNGGSNGDATVSVIGGDTSLYGYFWSPTGGVNATAAGLPAGIYTITVTYIADGCTVIVNDTITQPSPVTSSVKYALVCGNKVMAVDSTGGGKPPYTYNWSPSGSTTATANLSSGSYTLTVTDSNGCKTTFSLVAPTTDPVANFVPVPDTVSPGDSIKFVNLSLGGSKWYWTFGDGNSSIDSLPYNIYNYGGSYTVYLKVTNALGCSDSIAENIFVKEGIITPNVFTPNGDGINDGFHVNAYGMKDYKIDIYDRWGLLIFQGTGSDNDWTGRTMAGEMVSVGTYYYIITASDAKGKSFNVKGYLELIR